MNFFKQTIKNFKRTGAVAPVRKKTAQKLVDSVRLDIAMADVVFEFGPGTGVISDEILKLMHKDATLFLIEANPEFTAHLKIKYLHDDRVIVVTEYAQNLRTEALSVDVVINSIPLSLIDKVTRTKIYSIMFNILKNNGVFAQYQYSKITLPQFFEAFKRSIKCKLTFSNIIPTWLMIARK